MKIKEKILDVLFITVGTGLFAIALTVFLEPNEISPGGITGLASVISHLIPIPTGILSLVFNIPLLIVGFFKIGKQFMVKTLITTSLVSVMIDTLSMFMPVYTSDKILAALYGGALAGIGFAIIFMRGSSTGGTDIIAKLVSLTKPHFSIGRIILISDAVVIIAASIAYRNIDTALYTFLTILIMSFLIDYFVYGADTGKLVMIITKKPDEIKKQIISHVRRGATQLSATGAYSNSDTYLLLCAVRLNEVATLDKIVKNIDPNAFLIITTASQILGQGFTKK